MADAEGVRDARARPETGRLAYTDTPESTPPMALQTRLLHKLARVPDELDLGGRTEDAIARSFLVLVATNFLTKLGDSLASPKITLTWLLQSIGASPLAVGMLVPIRESGSMLPQIWLADHVNGRSRIGWLFRVGTAVQGLAVLAMVAAAWSLGGTVAGWTIVLLLVLFSLGRCLCSIVWKAVLGKSIPKRLRGQTTGWSSSAAGLAASAVGLLLLWQADSRNLAVILSLLVAAGAIWLVANAVYGLLHEPPDHDEAGRRDTNVIERFRLLAEERDFRGFVIARGLLMASALVAPFYILLAGEGGESSPATFGGLIVANGVASLVSAPFWGRFSDVSSRRVLMLSGSIVSVLGFATGLVGLLLPTLFATVWFVPLLYFVLEVAHQGVRVGRKTYVVDLAGDDERVDYVSTSNSLIGILLLVVGAITGAIAIVLPPLALIVIFSCLALAGVLMSGRLPEVQLPDRD